MHEIMTANGLSECLEQVLFSSINHFSNVKFSQLIIKLKNIKGNNRGFKIPYWNHIKGMRGPVVTLNVYLKKIVLTCSS